MNWLIVVSLPLYVASSDVVTTGDALITSGAKFLSTSDVAISGVRSVLRLVAPDARPPPDEIVSVFVPSDSMLFWMATWAPLPTATRRMTAPTPIRMPSTVRLDRSLLAVTPRSANRTVSYGFTTRSPTVRGTAAAGAADRSRCGRPPTGSAGARGRRRPARG